MITLEQLRAEIESALGEMPPFLVAAEGDLVILESLWRQKQQNVLQNPLPALFKAMVLAYLAQYHATSYSLIVRSCALGGFGLSGEEVLTFLQSPVPSDRQISTGFRTGTSKSIYEHEWPAPRTPLWYAVLWATIRIALRRDHHGRCRNLLIRRLGQEHYDRVVMLCAFAMTERTWTDAHPDLDPRQDIRVREYQRGLAEDEPALHDWWKTHRQRFQRRRRRTRERRLVAELARQDRSREDAAEAEKRFRRTVEVSPFPLMVYADDGQILLINHAWQEISGWTMSNCPTIAHWFAQAQPGEKWDPADAAELRQWADAVEEGEQTILTQCGQQRVWDMSTASLGKLPDGRYALVRSATDVTERKRLETALREHARRMINTLEAITDGFVAVDHETRFVYLNGEAERLLGVKRQDMIGRTYVEVFPAAADSPFVIEGMQALAEGQVRHIEEQAVQSDRWFEMHFYPSHEGMSIYFRDVTERRQMQAKLAQSEETFRQIASHMHEIFFMGDPVSRTITYVNPAIERVWGVSLADLEKDPQIWMDAIHPEDRAIFDALLQANMRGEEAAAEFRIVWPNGQVRWVRDRGTPLMDENGKVNRTVGIITDITAQREAELALDAGRRLMQQITDHLGSMVWMTNVDGSKIHFVSKAVETIWGLSAAEFCAMSEADHWSTTVLEEDRDRLAQDINHLIQGHAHALYFRIRRTDGQIRQIRSSGFPVNDSSGKCTQLVGVAEDVTELIQSRRACANLEQSLEAILAISPLPIISTDVEGRVTVWSKAAETLFGWMAADVIGKPNPLIMPEEGHAIQAALQQRGPLYGYPLACRCQDGQTIAATVSIWPVCDHDGTVTGFTGVVDPQPALP